jgi:acetyl coenzyme A synthetase (ADP forming)-like protein
MTTEVIQKILKPNSIALIGASREPKKLGHITLRNLIEGGFKGRIFPINPEAGEVLGLQAYQSVSKVPEEIDLALIAVPAALVPKVIEECGQKDVKAAIIISAGFREVGPQGEACEQETVRAAQKGGMRILGPNCLGVINASENLDATISRVVDPKKLKSGNIAFVSQSGAFGASLYSWAQGRGIGFDKLISFGNMCDIDESDMFEYLATDEKTKVIVMYMEGVKDGRKFLKTASRVSLVKPIVIMKIGRSSRGSKAAKSHTGALTGSNAIYDAAFKQSGVIRAANTSEMFDFAKAFATQPLLRGNKMVIVTNAGGPGVAATDACEEEGLELAEIDENTRKSVRALIPSFASALNPIDTTPQVSPRVSGEIFKILLSDKRIDGAISILVGSKPREYAEEVVNAHAGVAQTYDKPIVLSWTVDKSAEDLVIRLEEKGVPVYETPERAVKSMAALWRYKAFLEKHPLVVRPRIF